MVGFWTACLMRFSLRSSRCMHRNVCSCVYLLSFPTPTLPTGCTLSWGGMREINVIQWNLLNPLDVGEVVHPYGTAPSDQSICCKHHVTLHHHPIRISSTPQFQPCYLFFYHGTACDQTLALNRLSPSPTEYGFDFCTKHPQRNSEREVHVRAPHCLHCCLRQFSTGNS